MAVDRNGLFISGRSHPRLVLVEAIIQDNDGLVRYVLSSPEMDDVLILKHDTLAREPRRKVRYGHAIPT